MTQKPLLLITGGLGFIGTNLTLSLRHHYFIRILDNDSSKSKNFNTLCDFVDIIKGDVTDYQACLDAMTDVDYVVHLAAKGSVVESMVEPLENLKTNVIGTLNVLRAASANKVKQLVFSSTGGAIMGNAPPPVSELSLPRPISPYGASKLACEGYCSSFSASFDLPVTVLRFGNVYGEHSNHKKGIVNTLLQCAQENKNLKIFGDGKASRDFIHVSDICHAIQLSLKKSSKGMKIYHVATGIETDILSLVKIMERVSNRKINTQFLSKREGEVDRNFSGYALANEKLGYKPRLGLDKGIEIVWNWYNLVLEETD
jgi:UDP-glucose 4-epimerase